MKILLIAPHFFPDEHIGASRWNRLSKYLIRDGHEIYVIASNIISDSNKSQRSTKLVRVDYRNSGLDQFLSHLRGVKKSWPAEIKRQNTSLKNESKSSSLYTNFINYIGKYLRFPGVYWWSSKDIIKKGVQIVNSEDIDIIIATFPFSVSISSAHNISKKTKTPWIADMRDGWSSYYFGEYKKGTFLFKILKQVERFYLNSALSVVTISKTLANSICVRDHKIVIIPNVFDPEEQKMIKTKVANNNPNISFSFAGSVHDKHCWEIFFEGLSEIGKSMPIDNVVVNYYGNYFKKVQEKRNKFDLYKSIISNHGYVEKKNLMIELSQSDILLVFGFKGAYGDSVTTGKIFDYIELKKPVLVFGPKTSELAKLVEKTGIGLVISNVEDSKAVLKTIIQNKDEFKKNMKEKIKYDEISKYSAPDAAKFYVDSINKLLKK